MRPWATVGDLDQRGSKSTLTSAFVTQPESSDEKEPSAKLARVDETPPEIVCIDETPEPSQMEAAQIALGYDIEEGASAPIAPAKMGVVMVVRMARKDGQWSVGSTGDSVSTNMETSSSSSDDDDDSDEETSQVVNDEVSWHADLIDKISYSFLRAFFIPPHSCCF